MIPMVDTLCELEFQSQEELGALLPSVQERNGVSMQPGYARTSLILFGISILLLIALTVFEAALVGATQSVERIITFLALVLPAGAGSVFGGLSLTRREGMTGLAVAGLLLNALFALFHLAILLSAG